jgi:predicted TIM-barrel fold metal-dependent hydrolase
MTEKTVRPHSVLFGPDRGMFESNFPPDGVSSSYAVLWNAFKRLAAGYSADEKAKLFSGTAKRVYRLGWIAVAVAAHWSEAALRS